MRNCVGGDLRGEMDALADCFGCGWDISAGGRRFGEDMEPFERVGTWNEPQGGRGGSWETEGGVTSGTGSRCLAFEEAVGAVEVEEERFHGRTPYMPDLEAGLLGSSTLERRGAIDSSVSIARRCW
jgi:hypothetical protein